jgi:methylmalonyl-CoA mutase cobalamin-binding domain/chain
MNDLLNELKEAVIEGYADRSIAITERCLAQGIPAQVIFEEAIVKGIQEAGVYWDCNRYRVPDVILSADAFNSAVAVIEKQLHPGGEDQRPKVLMGVVEGDVHDLGKNIVSAMLRGAGIHVVDIGVDLPAAEFVKAVRREQPKILGIGAYMSSSMLEIPEVIRALVEAGLRAQIKILIGGVPISQAFAVSVGADSWAPDALDAVRAVKELLAQVP